MLTNRLSASRRIYITIMRVLLVLAAVLTAALVVFMIVYVLSKGLPYVTWHLLSTKPSYVSGTIGILPDICNTVQILLASLLIVLPLGVGAAVYGVRAEQKARRGHRIRRRDALGHPVHHLRSGRHAVFL